MRDKFLRFIELIKEASPKRTFAVMGFLFVVLALPLTVKVAQEQQETRQQAAGNECAGVVNTGCTPGDENNVNGKIYGCHLVSCIGVWDNLNKSLLSSIKPVECPYGVINTGKDKTSGSNDYTCAPAPTQAPAQTTAPQTTAPQAAETSPPTSNLNQTPAQGSAAVAVTEVTGVSGSKCKLGTKPNYEASPNGEFSYCDNKGILHAGTCKNGDTPGPSNSSDSGVSCYKNPPPSDQRLLTRSQDLPAESAQPSPTPSPTPTSSSKSNDCTAIPGQGCKATCGTSPAGTGVCTNSGTCCSIQNECGAPYPPGMHEKIFQSAGRNSFLPGEQADIARGLGYTEEQVQNAGLRGDPFNNALVAGTPSDQNPGGGQLNYTNCLSILSDFGTPSNSKVICYKNGQEVANIDIPVGKSANTDKIAATVLGPQCVGGFGWPPDAEGETRWFGCPQEEFFTPGEGACGNGKTTTAENPDSKKRSKKTTIGLDFGLTGLDTSESNSLAGQSRNFVISLLDQSNGVVETRNANLTFDKLTQKFTGDVGFSSLKENVEGLKVAVDSPGYFQSITETILPIAANQRNSVSVPDLLAGDIVQDHSTNILDYTTFLSCSIFSTDGGSNCRDKQGNSLREASDLSGNGIVDQDDYNILLRAWKLLENK